jgi:hypothetical protein
LLIITTKKKCYQEVNSIRKGFKPKTLLIRGKEGNIVSYEQKDLQMWSEYYEKYFELEDGMDSNGVEEWTMCTQTAEPYAEPPNVVDMDLAVSKLKTGKATGHYQILGELIKGVR